MLPHIPDAIFRQSSPPQNLKSYYYRKVIKLGEVKHFSWNNSHSTYDKGKNGLTKNKIKQNYSDAFIVKQTQF